MILENTAIADSVPDNVIIKFISMSSAWTKNITVKVVTFTSQKVHGSENFCIFCTFKIGKNRFSWFTLFER